MNQWSVSSMSAHQATTPYSQLCKGPGLGWELVISELGVEEDRRAIDFVPACYCYCCKTCNIVHVL